MSETARPLQLIEDDRTDHRFLLYTTKNGARLEVIFDGEEPWFTQLDMATMYGVSVPTVNEHIAKFQSEGELDEATIRKFRIVRHEGNRTVNREIEYYGLVLLSHKILSHKAARRFWERIS